VGLLKTARDAGYAQACQDIGFEKEAFIGTLLKGGLNVAKWGLRQAGISGTKSWQFARNVGADGVKTGLPRLQTGGNFKGSWDTMSTGNKIKNVGQGVAGVGTLGAGSVINKANEASKVPTQMMGRPISQPGF